MTIKPRDDVALMDGYHSPQVQVDVRLNTNEAPFGPPAAWRERVEELASQIDWNRYPDRGATTLRSRIGDLHGVGPDQVFVANGSNEVLQTVLLTYGGAGRTAAVWEPTYALHSHIAAITGTAVAVGHRGPDFETEVAEVERVFREAHPSVVFLCSPNNPTGVVEDEVTVRAVLDHALDDDALLVVDEAYGQFASYSALDLVSEDSPLVVVRTFSKTWSMAAARLGYLVGPAWVVAELQKVVLPYHLDSFKQLAGVLALDFAAEMNDRVAELVTERQRLESRLGELAVQVWPSGANFILFRPRDHEAREVWRQLVERSILVRDCSSWPRLDGCLRVTVGTQDQDDAFLDALQEILK